MLQYLEAMGKYGVQTASLPPKWFRKQIILIVHHFDDDHDDNKMHEEASKSTKFLTLNYYSHQCVSTQCNVQSRAAD